ncbi:PLDc N-terminal domain-containing protein [Pedobacter frigiditerrae]|uniref:PLDc N-terminal domain-containing protein n=1 Tax=Pedobacter frigiditerrae TaxID=2530452 RepID=UPI00292F46E5|nr:PLDc N-terminal domain-containing protein [Pedobacter frigiditerrae]
MLLEFFNLGSIEIIIILVILSIPFGLMIYALIDIMRSDFRESNTKLIFFVLVLLMPCLGSIIYLLIKKNYIYPKEPPFNQFP